MKKIISFLDRVIIKILGIESTIRTEQVQFKGNMPFVTFTESNKRYRMHSKITDFTSQMKNVDKTNQKKFEHAMGKVIAKDLTISFTSVSIEWEKN